MKARPLPPLALAFVLTFVGGFGPAGAAEPPPTLTRGNAGYLVLSHLPPVLGQSEIRKQLQTGLTATLAFEIKLATAPAAGAARLDVRFEPWEAVYHVTQIDASGKVARLKLPSFERLADYWAHAELAVLDQRRLGPPPWIAEVRLKVIPFSRAEQLETQRWLSRSLSDREPGSAGALSGTLEKPATPLGQVLDILLSTSIERGALTELAWRLTVPRREGA